MPVRTDDLEGRCGHAGDGGASAIRKTFDIDLSFGEFRREEGSFDVTLVADSADGSTGREDNLIWLKI